MAEVQVVRNVRIPLSLDIDIRRIAEYEDRTISKVMQRILRDGVSRYLEAHENFMLQSEEKKANYEQFLKEIGK